MAWSDIELHVGGEDTGTSGFGAAPGKGNSVSGGYQVDKLVTITAGAKVSQSPALSSSSTKQCVCFSVDTNVYVIDHNQRDSVFDLALDKVVDCVALSTDSSFLVVGDRSGQLHFVDVALRKAIFSEVLASPDSIAAGQPCFHSAIFWSTASERGHSLAVTLLNGSVYFFSRIAFDELHDAIVEGDMAAAQEIRSNISTKVFSVAELHADWIGQVLPIWSSGKPGFLVTGKGRCGLSIWGSPSPASAGAMEDSSMELIDAVSRPLEALGGIRRAQLTQDGRSLLLLSEAGKLSVWNAKCFVLMSQLVIDDATAVLDFQLASSVGKTWRGLNKGSLKRDEPHIVMLMKSNSKYFLEIRSFPFFETVYRKGVTSSAHLSMPLSSMEKLFIVNDVDEFISSPTSSRPIPTKLCVHCFSEAIPEKRLASLLRKGQFDEALIYAGQFGLDVQAVHEARCSWLLQSPGWDIEAHQNDLLAKLTSAMDAIEDTDYVVQCCLDDPPPCQMATAAMLKYADKRLSVKLSGKLPQAEKDALTAQRDELESTTIRFGTYQLAFGGSPFNPSRWQAFRSLPIVSEIHQCLLQKHISAATILWRRHKYELHHHVTLASLQQLLGAVPDVLASKSLVGWLRDAFLPSFIDVLHRNVDAEVILNKWVKERALRLELTEKPSWPSNALTLVATVANALHSPHSHQHSSNQHAAISAMCTPAAFVKQVTSLSANATDEDDLDLSSLHDSSDKSLRPLLQQLTDLHLLHTRYKCPLSLQQFSLESKRTIGFRLLERVAAVEVIQQALTQQIVPYCQQNMLSSDQVLLDYIKDFIANHGHLWRNYASSTVAPGSSAPWEAKLLAIVPHVKKMELRLSAVFELMRVAALPWSSGMDSLVQQAMTWEHSRHRELQQQVRTAQLCSMLRRYGISNVGLKQSTLAKDMLHRIARSEEPTCMADALELVSVFHHLHTIDAYLCRLQWLCRKERLAEISELIASVSACDAAVQIAQGFLNWSSQCIDTFQFNTPSLEIASVYERRYKQIVQAACSCLQGLFTTQGRQNPQMSEQECRWIRMLKLSDEFGLHAKDSDLKSKAEREALLMHWLNANISAVTYNAEDGRSPSIQPIERLGHLLELPVANVLLLCSEKSIESDQLPAAVGFCRLLLGRDGDLSPDVSGRLLCALRLLSGKVLQTCHSESTATFSSDVTAASLAESCLTLTAHFLSKCSLYGIVDTSALAKSACRICDLFKACSSTSGGPYAPTADWQWSAGNSRTFSKLVTGDTFDEDTLVLSPREVFPLLHTLNSTLLPPYTNAVTIPGELQQFCCRSFQQEAPTDPAQASNAWFTASPRDLVTLGTVTQQMTSMLIANGSCQLAVAYAQESLFQFLQFFAFNYADSCRNEALKESLDGVINAVLTKARQVIVELWENLLSKVLAYRTLDLPLVLGYMLRLPMPKVFAALNQSRLKCHGDHARLQALSWLGMQYLQRIVETGVDSSSVSSAHKECAKMYDLATWGVKLSAHKISLTADFHKNRNEQKAVLQLLLSRPSVELDLLLDYSRYFDFNRERLLQLRVQGSLLPKEEETDEFSQQVQQEKEPAPVPTVEEIVAIACQAAVQKDMLQVVYEVLQKMDPYDYDRIHCALAMLKRLWPKDEAPNACIIQGPQLLDILFHYRRHCPPSQAEVEFVTSAGGDEVQFLQPVKKMPELSRKRLPFHMLLFGNKAGKVLTSEANVETLPTLIPLALLLKISTDQLHMTAVQNTVNAYLAAKNRTPSPPLPTGQQPTSPMGHSTPQAASLFSSLQTVLVSIQDPKNAIAVAAWILTRLEKGPEKLAALKGCLHLSNRWAAATSDSNEASKAAKSAAKFTLLHNQLAVELLLQQKSPYSEAEVASLAALPVEQLIAQLYQHSSIAWNAHGQVSADFDIHAVVDEASVIYGIDGDKIRLQLVKKWLPNVASLREQTSLWAEPSINLAEQEMEDEVNLQRVIFLLLHHASSEKGALYLLQYAYKETASTITNTCKARAMRVLFAIVPDVSTLERISQLKLEELWAYLYSLVCVAELDRLHISQSLTTFQHCNKEGLVRGLLKNHRTSPQALRFAVGFSLDQHLYDAALWGDLLQQMLNLAMLNDLQQSLISASHVPQLLKIPHLLRLWQAVLVQPLLDVRSPVDERAKAAFSNVLQFLMLCPLVVDIDTASLTNNLLRLELPAHALCCALVGCGHTSVAVEDIVERSGAEDLLAKCEALSDGGISLAYQAMSYLEGVLDNSRMDDESSAASHVGYSNRL